MDRRADFVALKEMHMLRGNRKHNDIGRKVVQLVQEHTIDPISPRDEDSIRH